MTERDVVTTRLLGRDAGGCTEACSEMHTFSYPCEQAIVSDRPRRRFGVRFMFAWYDLWVGVFIDRRKRRVYIFPVPCIGLVVAW